jgi:hypothetical protein
MQRFRELVKSSAEPSAGEDLFIVAFWSCVLLERSVTFLSNLLSLTPPSISHVLTLVNSQILDELPQTASTLAGWIRFVPHPTTTNKRSKEIAQIFLKRCHQHDLRQSVHRWLGKPHTRQQEVNQIEDLDRLIREELPAGAKLDARSHANSTKAELQWTARTSLIKLYRPFIETLLRYQHNSEGHEHLVSGPGEQQPACRCSFQNATPFSLTLYVGTEEPSEEVVTFARKGIYELIQCLRALDGVQSAQNTKDQQSWRCVLSPWTYVHM